MLKRNLGSSSEGNTAISGIAVTIRGDLFHKPVTITAGVANLSCTTRISRRLSQKLGLTNLVDVALEATSYSKTVIWKRSTVPLSIRVEGHDLNCFPVVCWNEADAYYEMLLGKDVIRRNRSLFLNSSMEYGPPDPGPSYSDEPFGGNAFQWLSPRRLPPSLGRFLELSCANSRAVDRLALNCKTRQLIAIYHDSKTVYRYCCLPKALEEQLFDAFENGGSLGSVLAKIKSACKCSTIDEFPSSQIFFVPPEVDEERAFDDDDNDDDESSAFQWNMTNMYIVYWYLR